MSQTERSPLYYHPGQAFLSQYAGEATIAAMVMAYVTFLHAEADLQNECPIPLAAIYRQFGMPEPLRAPLVDQQGILVDGNAGLILIKEDDPIVRQRFTEGHELMELLFDAHEQASAVYPLHWQAAEKERWCDRGAAELLMPGASFVPAVQALGVSLQTGQILAQRYVTSLMATLLHMIHYTSEPYALVMWHPAYSNQELARAGKMRSQPPKKLRIWWRVCSPGWAGGFIPRNKSVTPNSLIARTHMTRQSHNGPDQMHLGVRSIRCYTEAMPLQIADKSCVLSLLQYREGF